MQTHLRPRTKWVFPEGEWIKCPNKYSWVLHLRLQENWKPDHDYEVPINQPPTQRLIAPRRTWCVNQIVRDLTWPIPREKHQSWFQLSTNFVLNWDLIALNSIRRQSRSSGTAVSNPPWRWFEVGMAKSVKVSDVHYQMLVDVGKRWRMKPDDLVKELIQETYTNKTKRKWWMAFTRGIWIALQEGPSIGPWRSTGRRFGD